MAWRNLFGKKKTEESPHQSMEKMNETLEMLEKRERVLQNKIDAEVQRAKELLKKKNKSGALLAMKKKKLYEEQLARIGNQRHNIQTMLIQLEEATMNIETLNAQKQGAKAVKSIYGKNLTAEKIEQDMDVVRDTIEDHKDITDAISQPLAMDGFDEDELLDELNALESEELEKQMLGMDDDIAMPTVGKAPLPAVKAKPAKARTEEEDELAALEAEMNA